MDFEPWEKRIEMREMAVMVVVFLSGIDPLRHCAILVHAVGRKIFENRFKAAQIRGGVALDETQRSHKITEQLAHEGDIHRRVHANPGWLAVDIEMPKWCIFRRVSRVVAQDSISPLNQKVLIERSGLSQKGNRPIDQKVPVASMQPVVEEDLCKPRGATGPILHMRLRIFFQSTLG